MGTKEKVAVGAIVFSVLEGMQAEREKADATKAKAPVRENEIRFGWMLPSIAVLFRKNFWGTPGKSRSTWPPPQHPERK